MGLFYERREKKRRGRGAGGVRNREEGKEEFGTSSQNKGTAMRKSSAGETTAAGREVHIQTRARRRVMYIKARRNATHGKYAEIRDSHDPTGLRGYVYAAQFVLSKHGQGDLVAVFVAE